MQICPTNFTQLVKTFTIRYQTSHNKNNFTTCFFFATHCANFVQTKQTFYNFLQHFTKLYKHFLQHFTNINKIFRTTVTTLLDNFRQVYNTMHKLYKHITMLCNAVHNFAQLHTTLHNSTNLYTKSQKSYNTFTK